MRRAIELDPLSLYVRAESAEFVSGAARKT
jgi:hypothetical protein